MNHKIIAYPVQNGGKLVANLSIGIEDKIVIRAKLIEWEEGSFLISFPAHKRSDNDEYVNDVYTLDRDYSEKLVELAVRAYEKALDKEPADEKPKKATKKKSKKSDSDL